MNIFIKYNTNLLQLYNINDFNELKTNINTKLKLNSNNYYLIFNNKLLTQHNFNNIEKQNTNTNIIVDLNLKIVGGILKKAMKIVSNLLKPITTAFKDIILSVGAMSELLVDFVKIFFNLVKASITIFTPDKFINDVLYGSTAGIKLIFSSFLGSINSDLVSDSSKKNTSGGSGPFGVNEESKAGNKAICIPPTLTNIIFLIICPPLALFLHRGVKGALQIILCAGLTYYLYYFPGFIYAALHILC
jgi:uncharacterized membrane protein YqaE (UPF0057 family)